MSIDINAKAAQLLERLANSIYDRDHKATIDITIPFAFRTTEIQIVENFLQDTIQEAFKQAAEY